MGKDTAQRLDFGNGGAIGPAGEENDNGLNDLEEV
jgi:hypothetical protein